MCQTYVVMVTQYCGNLPESKNREVTFISVIFMTTILIISIVNLII